MDVEDKCLPKMNDTTVTEYTTFLNEDVQKEEILLTNKDIQKDEKRKSLVTDAHSSCVKHPTSYKETLINFIKGNCAGPGMFAMGEATKNAGLLLGPILSVILAIVCGYGNHALVNCSKTICKRRKLRHFPSFSETIQYCFEEGHETIHWLAPYMRLLSFVSIAMMQLGVCSINFVFVSSTFKNVFKTHGIHLDIHIYMVIILIPILLTSLIRNLKFITPLSSIANIFIFTGVVLTLSISLQDLPSVSTRNLVANVNQLPLFFGTALYSFEGINMVLPLRNEMKNPKKFDSLFGVLNIGLLVMYGLLISAGFIGYLKYGDDVKGSLTLNLPENIFSELVQLMVSMAVLFTYTLQLYILVDLVWPLITENYGPFTRPALAEKTFRMFCVFFTFALAECVPNIGLFISLVGAISGTTLALLFPAICDILLRWPSNFGVFKWRFLLNFFSLLMGVIGLITGCYFNIEAIIQTYR